MERGLRVGKDAARRATRALQTPEMRQDDLPAALPRVIGLLLAWAAFSTPVAAWEAAKGPPALDSMVGTRVDALLQSGETLRDVELVKLRPGPVAGTVVSVTLSGAEGTGRRVLGAAAVTRIDKSGGGPLLVYDEAAKALVRAGEKDLEAIRKAVQEAEESAPKPVPKSKQKEKPHPSPDEPAEPGPAMTDAEREEFFRKTGVRLWPEPTEEQQREAVARLKEFLDKVGAAMPERKMQLHETRFFLFYSDLPPQQATVAAAGLDKMYAEQCKAFGVPQGKNIWIGKEVIAAFRDREGFVRFEKEFFQREVGEAQGRTHLRPDGTVITACFMHGDLAVFATVLTHETTHGFMHRYKSPQPLPSWIEEGAAEFMAAVVVPGCKVVQNDQQTASARLRETRSLGGDFFTAKSIDTWQYGVASSLTEFMLRWDAKAYRAMIDGVKEGMGWEESLKKAYGVTPEELTERFGRKVGVPGLKP